MRLTSSRIPKRDTWAPTTAMLSRIPIHSPTSKPTTPVPKTGQPWPTDVLVEVNGGKYGRATVEHYRPTNRDALIIQAIFTVGSYPNRDTDGFGVVEFEVKEAAKVAGCARHADWMIDEIKRIGRAEITLYKPNGVMLSWFHIVAQIDMIDEKHARIYFTPGYMHNWAVDWWVHNEGLVAKIARIKSPRVRAIVQRNFSHGSDFDETLDQALTAIDAMNVNERAQRKRRAEISAAQEDGTLAKFGLHLYTNQNTGVKHIAFNRKAVDQYGLLQLPPPAPNAAMPHAARAKHRVA